MPTLFADNTGEHNMRRIEEKVDMLCEAFVQLQNKFNELLPNKQKVKLVDHETIW